MIVLTRLNGQSVAVNTDLIERAEATPDTVITTVDGAEYVVVESVPEVIGLIRDFRASLLVTASALESNARKPAATLHVLPHLPGH